jgi:hypothetical protein
MAPFGAVEGTPFALLLKVMATEARRDVQRSLERLEAQVGKGGAPRWLLRHVHEAIGPLERNYAALAEEVALVRSPTLGPGRLSRRRLLERIHRRSATDFSLIARLHESLASECRSGLAVEATEAVLGGWADRDLHLFRIAIPLVYFAEELRADLSEAGEDPCSAAGLLDACLQNAQRALDPVFREISTTATALREAARDFEPRARPSAPSIPAPTASRPMSGAASPKAAGA